MVSTFLDLSFLHFSGNFRETDTNTCPRECEFHACYAETSSCPFPSEENWALCCNLEMFQKSSVVGKSIMTMKHTCTLQNKTKKTVLLYQGTIII